MKPFQTFLFLISVVSVILLISYSLSIQEIKLLDKFKIKSINIESWLNIKDIEYADISNIIDDNKVDEPEIAPTIKLVKTDTIIIKDTLKILPKAALKPELLKAKVHKLEFSPNSKNSLHNFFKTLLKSNKTVHVLHIGDSQIEGDRITAFVRNKFQKKFGGSGVGLVPAKRLVPAFSMLHSSSDNWERYSVAKYSHKEYYNRAGIMGNFCRYAPFYNDSIGNDSIVYTAWVKLKKSNSSYALDRRFNNIKLFYGNNKKPVIIELFDGDKQLSFKSALSTPGIEIFKYRFKTQPKNLTIKFTGKDSPDIYGISIEGSRGVNFDNIAIRGSSGTFFGKINQLVSKKMLTNLNTQMLILEFGGNSVPYINSQKQADRYGRWFQRQLSLLKNKMPGSTIIVIGPADMSFKKDGNYISYPSLKYIRIAMKNATSNANCIYWDMFEAMGGENSMPEWVNAKPKLASSDYTHFTSRGAKIIANMFYNALIFEYNEFLKEKDKQKNKSIN